MAEDEEGTAGTLAACRHLISDLVGQCAGRVVDAPGDNVLAEFPTALEALRSALEIQGVLAQRNAELPPERRMQFRVGVVAIVQNGAVQPISARQDLSHIRPHDARQFGFRSKMLA